MGRLHRLFDHSKQLLTQLIQVHFSPQRRAKGFQRLLGIIFAPVEAPINEPLDALTKGLKQGSDDQRRADEDHAIVWPEQTGEQGLSGEDQREVDDQQSRSEQAVDQRAIDDDVDIPEAIAQDGDTKCNGKSYPSNAIDNIPPDNRLVLPFREKSSNDEQQHHQKKGTIPS